MEKRELQKPDCIYYSQIQVAGLELFLASTHRGLALLDFHNDEVKGIAELDKLFPGAQYIFSPEKNLPYETALREYFNGALKVFDLPLDVIGTPFQKQVWQALTEIPYGKTVTYKDIAVKINRPKAVRAVGMANNKNKIPIIIPCHRVIGSNGSLVGYGGGLHIKKKLLSLEGVTV